DGLRERGRDLLHVLEDLFDLALERLEGRLVDVVCDLATVGDAVVLVGGLGTGRQDDHVLADQARGALADRRVFPEPDVGHHLDVDARLPFVEPDPVDHAHLDTAHRDPGVGRYAGHVGHVRPDFVAAAGARLARDEPIQAVAGAQKGYGHQTDLRGPADL